MIQPNELRMGNWVNAEIYGDYEIIGISLFTNGNNLIFKSMEYYPQASSIDKLNPILLSEQWLIKLGFRKQKNEFYYIETNYSSQYIELWENNDDYESFSFIGYITNDNIEESKKSIDPIFLDEIKYVHQIQNLYFSLTGRELTVA